MHLVSVSLLRLPPRRALRMAFTATPRGFHLMATAPEWIFPEMAAGAITSAPPSATSERGYLHRPGISDKQGAPFFTVIRCRGQNGDITHRRQHQQVETRN